MERKYRRFRNWLDYLPLGSSKLCMISKSVVRLEQDLEALEAPQ